VQEKRVGNNHV